MQRFLGMTEEEIKENERLWREENGSKLQPVGDAAAQLRSIGVTPGAVAGEAEGQTAEAPLDMAAPAGDAAGAETAPSTPAQ